MSPTQPATTTTPTPDPEAIIAVSEVLDNESGSLDKAPPSSDGKAARDVTFREQVRRILGRSPLPPMAVPDTNEVVDTTEDNSVDAAIGTKKQKRNRGYKVHFMFWFFLVIPVVVLALTLHFGTKSRAPSSEDFVGFQPGPTTRGTMNIVLMCLSTLITCAYAVVHNQVPEEIKPASDGSWQERLSEFLYSVSFFERLEMISLGVMFPELLLFQAIIDLQDAMRIRNSVERLTRKRFRLSLSFFVGMRGFRDGDRRLSEDDFLRFIWEREPRPRLALTTFWIGRGNTRTMHDEFVGQRKGIDWNYIEGIVRARSRADIFVKIFAVLQLLWMAIQTLARWGEHISISPLEVTTCSHVVCAVFTYGFWFFKPHDVREPIDLSQFCTHDLPLPPVSYQLPTPGVRPSGTDVARRMEEIAAEEQAKNNKSILSRIVRVGLIIAHRYMWTISRINRRLANIERTRDIRNDPFDGLVKAELILGNKAHSPWPLTMAILFSLLYAGVHCAIWNLAFQNSEGQKTWRACSSIFFGMPLIFLFLALAMLLRIQMNLYTETSRNSSIRVMVWLMLVANVTARGMIFFLAIYAFWRQPAEVYRQVEWSQFFPFLD